MTPNRHALLGAIQWLSSAGPLEMPLCPIHRLRHWSYSTERCSEDELAGDLAWLITAGLVRWYMPGTLTLSPAGRRVGVDVVKRCML